MFSKDVDTLLDKRLDSYPTSNEVDDELSQVRTEMDIKIDSLKKLYHEEVELESNKFHVIVGSFKVPQNAVNFRQKLIEMGYAAQIIRSSNGFDMVSIQSYNNLNRAVNEISFFRNSIAPDAWIYFSNQ